MGKKGKKQQSGERIVEKEISTLEELAQHRSEKSDSSCSRGSHTPAFFFPSSDDEKPDLRHRGKGPQSPERQVIRSEWKFDPPTTHADTAELRAKRKEAKEAQKRITPPRAPRATLWSTDELKAAGVLIRDSVSKHWWTYLWSFAGICCFVGVMYMKAQEEYFSIYENLDVNSPDVDHYGALEVSSQASTAEIRKAYRQLSLRWHPDRNQGCEHCNDKFLSISEAYDTLSNPERRQVYDTSSREFEAIPSRTVTLNEQNFARMVSDSLDIWLILVYSDFDSMSKHFATIWEGAATSYEGAFSFGRINAIRDSRVMQRLPVKIRLYPTVIMLAPGHTPQMFSQMYSVTPFSFVEWIRQEMPPYQFPITSEDQLMRFLLQAPPPGGAHCLLITRAFDQIKIKSAAYKWYHVFKIGVLSPNVLPPAVAAAWGVVPTGGTMLLSIAPGAHSHFTQAQDPRQPPPPFYPLRKIAIGKRTTGSSSFTTDLNSALHSLQLDFAPYLSRQNAERLCRSNPTARVYCLVVVDLPQRSTATAAREEESVVDEQTTDQLEESVKSVGEVLALVKNSRDTFEQSGEDYIDQLDEDEEDMSAASLSHTHIQVVQVTTQRIYRWRGGETAALIPSAPPAPFYDFWQYGLNTTQMFLLDLEGYQIATSIKMTPVALENIYFTLHDGMLKFRPWPSSTSSRRRCLPETFERNCLYDHSFSWTALITTRIRTLTWIQWGFAALLFFAVHRLVSRCQAARCERLAAGLVSQDQQQSTKKD